MRYFMTDHNEVAMLEALQEMLQRKFGKTIAGEHIKNLYDFAELLVDAASGEFKCKSCGGKFRLYAINLSGEIK